MKKVSRKVPQSVKVKRRVEAAVSKALIQHISNHKYNYSCIKKPTSIKIDKDQEGKIYLQITKQNKPEPFFLPVEQVKQKTCYLVENWKESWKWLSNWAFWLIVFFATTPFPPEILNALPENIRTYLITFTALCGFVGRFINQSRSKE